MKIVLKKAQQEAIECARNFGTIVEVPLLYVVCIHMCISNP